MSKAQKKDDVSVGGLRIVYQDTTKELEELILASATNALKALYKGEKNHFTEVAQQIKHEIEETQEGAWHVIVGKSFGSFVSHEVKRYVHTVFFFSCIASLYHFTSPTGCCTSFWVRLAFSYIDMVDTAACSAFTALNNPCLLLLIYRGSGSVRRLMPKSLHAT
ncbi:unnamed protein product [Phytophthora lilii]|uniref:Dynein light chain n=1 Tax=Phytophthora lilii TaxID=2077276 RepID=A0A9W6U2U2_9STRA|nr:unnamed protein product [Phytophthora lilii]